MHPGTAQDAVQMEKCIVYIPILMSLLLDLHSLVCKRKDCSRQMEYNKTFSGTCLVVSWGCSAGHFGGRWAPQPFFEGVQAGNLLLASAILVSGNSLTKIGFLFQAIKMRYFKSV